MHNNDENARDAVDRVTRKTLIRETVRYRVFDNGRGSIILEAKQKGVRPLRMSLYLKRTWDAETWVYIQGLTSDESFNTACCIELGVGAFTKK